MAASFGIYDDDLNKHDFLFVLHVTNNLFLEGQRSYNDLSKFDWLYDIIYIFQVLRYKVIFGPKFFFQYLWFFGTRLPLGWGFKPNTEIS